MYWNKPFSFLEQDLSIFELFSMPTTILSPQRKVIYVNSQMKDLLQRYGTNMENIENKFCYKLFYGRSEICENCPSIEDLIASNSAFEFERKHQILGRDFKIVLNPIINSSSGELEAILHYIRDITEEKKIEEELNRLRFLKDFEKEKLQFLNRYIDSLTGSINLLKLIRISGETMPVSEKNDLIGKILERLDSDKKEILDFRGQK